MRGYSTFQRFTLHIQRFLNHGGRLMGDDGNISAAFANANQNLPHHAAIIAERDVSKLKRRSFK
ncbi:hypothetical protein Pcaca05_13730 [Pectobacterium carotovorum subsp. carotovorum]|nr:hypothetical protein Pcaca05_13730 [Pectobacterium carotovorum subsp. carotovorum]